MNAYKSFCDGQLQELGEVGPSDVTALLADADTALSSGQPSYSLGFCRSDSDFLEICPVGRSQYLLHADLLATPWSFKRFLTRKSHIERIVTGAPAAIQTVLDFMERPREEFERIYR